MHILKIIGGLYVRLTRERWILHWSVGHRLGGQAMDGLVGEGVVGLVSFTIGKLHTEQNSSYLSIFEEFGVHENLM